MIQREPIERLVSVAVGRDEMTVTLTLSPHASAKLPPTSELVDRVLHLATGEGVTVPIERRVVTNAVAAWVKRGARMEVVIARGQPPAPGADAQVTLRRPKAKDGGDRIGKRNQGRVVNVEAGAVLATVTPPLPGTPGRSVKGDVVAAEPGRAAQIQIGPLVTAEESDGVITYRARATGILTELSPTRIEVADDIEIQGSIDRETGNLDVWGSVTIRGSVIDGFSVRARGSVIVAGSCESAYIESGGDVTVGGGILGRSGITIVKCKGDCTARFVENATVEAGGTMTVRDFVLHSRILAGAIEVYGRGTVLSSHLAAERSISASSFGSDARLPVEIVAGNHPLEWRTFLRLERELRFARRGTLAGADRPRGKGDPKSRAAADRAAGRRRRAEVLENNLRRRRKAMMDTLMAGGGPRIRVGKEVFPRTHIRVGLYELDVDKPLRGGVFRVDPEHGIIVWEPAS